MAKEFLGFIVPGIPSSECFGVLTSDNERWVVRAQKTGKNAKRLFNQYLAGLLANEIGLASPNTVLIDISPIRDKIELANLADSTNIAVGSQLLEGLSSVLPPFPYDPMAKDFPRLNKEHLSQLLSEEALGQICGYRVFSCWLRCEDDHKYANLYVLNGCDPVFLDFDLAFGGAGYHGLGNYLFEAMLSGAPFTEGISCEIERFSPWLVRLGNVDPTTIEKKLAAIPIEWNVEEYFVQKVLALLFDNLGRFIDQFTYAMELPAILNKNQSAALNNS